jgi:hypothetical protein
VIVLGIAPGVQALAYSVVAFNGVPLGHPIDCDVLHGGRAPQSQSTFALAKRCRVHHLVLGVVLDRNPPGVIAVGPPVTPKEPPEYVAAIRLMIGALAAGFNVPVVDVPDRRQLMEAIAEGERSLWGAVKKNLSVPLGSRDQRILLATGTAVAGAYHVKQRPVFSQETQQ